MLWERVPRDETQRYVDIAPQVANGLVYVSTISRPPNGRGTLYALDAESGEERWRFDTIMGEWAVPEEASGGGAWYTPSVAGDEVYWGIANPLPWGGSPAHPNGGAYAGPALYTDSLLVLDARTGKLLWYDQVTTHDVRDQDFQLPPILGSDRVDASGLRRREGRNRDCVGPRTQPADSGKRKSACTETTRGRCRWRWWSCARVSSGAC